MIEGDTDGKEAGLVSPQLCTQLAQGSKSLVTLTLSLS